MKCGRYYNINILVVMVLEYTTNKAGLVDVDTTTVWRGMELLPLRNKIFSGWYNCVGI